MINLSSCLLTVQNKPIKSMWRRNFILLMYNHRYPLILLVVFFINAVTCPLIMAAAPKGIRYKRPKPVRSQPADNAPVETPHVANGPRKTVAVWPKYQQDFRFPSVDELVIDELVNSNQYTVVERLNVQALEMEANLFEDVRHVGAQLIFEVAVTSVDQRTSRGLQFGLGDFGLGDGIDVVVGTSRTTAKATVVLRVIDTRSGEILSSQRVTGVSTGSGLNLGFAHQKYTHSRIDGFNMSFGKIKDTSVGKAVSKAVKLAVTKTTNKLNDHLWEARVADVDEDFVYLNAGQNAGLATGNQLIVSRLGKTITDPQTGAVLDVVRIPICEIEVVSVKEKIAVCRITTRYSTVSADTTVEKNQVVHLKSTR
jgi:curli biogenesis system outer membrane secretion channel CsgG